MAIEDRPRADSDRGNKVTCFFCEKYGHYEADCRGRERWLERHPNVKELLEKEETAKKTKALYANEDLYIPGI